MVNFAANGNGIEEAQRWQELGTTAATSPVRATGWAGHSCGWRSVGDDGRAAAAEEDLRRLRER